jgi:hypothetical protein
MIKKLIKLLFSIFIVLIILITYLSLVGINTNAFNDKIKSEILKINRKLNLELKNVKFLLRLSDFTINIKTLEPNLFFDDNKLELENIKTNISLKSFFNKEFSIDDLQVSTKAIKLKDIVKLSRSFDNSVELFILKQVIKDGFLVGDIDINFDNNGNVKDDYKIKGFIKNAKLGILKNYSIENLNLLFNIKNKEFLLEDIGTEFNQIKLTSPAILIKEKKDVFYIKGKVSSKEKNIDISLLNKFFAESLKQLDINNINFASNNNFTFNINKKFKISNFDLKSKINLKNLDYKNDFLKIKNYLPNFEKLIKLKDHKIFINYNKNQFDLNGEGKVLIGDKLDFLNYKIKKKQKEYIFDTNINLVKNSLLIDFLNYKKEENTKSLISLKGLYKINKKIIFDKIIFEENSNKFLIKDLNLNNKLKIVDLELLEFDYQNNNKIRNKFNLKKNKKNYKIAGKSFDVSKLIDSLLNSENYEETSSIFNNLNSSIDLKIDKTYLDKTTFVNNLNANLYFKNNEIYKLNLDSVFPNNKKLIITINTNENKEKITTLFSGYPKPIVKQYKFIKGFEGGILDFYSIKKNDISNSVLKIDNFKVQEVPILAKLLTLASLQGIADLLTGEGIRFTDFEMKFSNKKELMTIDEMYAIGPAISVLMEGYIETKKLISLRGTLVPATTINRSIASIPLIGKILVGKKTGEGVFGVSFKIKGPPKDLKTTVNPVKTLTPRFITRTLEKIKKN